MLGRRCQKTPSISRLNPSSTTITVNETQALLVNCSAMGTPVPNVTWHGAHGDVIDEDLRKATINNTNVTRDDSGMYNCCVTNNPNEAAACKGILVNVQYKPEINVNGTFYSYNESKIIVRCMARGEPSPQISLYDPSNRSISGYLYTVSGSVLKLVTIDKDSYGLYRCRAENILGYDEHFVNVSRTDSPSETSKSITYVISPTSKGSQVPFSKWIRTRPSSLTNIVSWTPTLFRGKSSSPVGRNGINKDTILLAAGGTVSFVLITTIIILTVLILRKHSKNKDAQGQQGDNEAPSLPLEAAKNTMPIYSKVDLSKKKRNRPHETLEDMPIYAQVDKSKKKDGIKMEPHKTAVSGTLGHEPPNLIPLAVDIEAVSRGSTTTVLDERKPKENHVGQHFLSGTQDLYQQLDVGSSLSKDPEYQSLQRKKEEIAQPSRLPFEVEHGQVKSNVNHHSKDQNISHFICIQM